MSKIYLFLVSIYSICFTACDGGLSPHEQHSVQAGVIPDSVLVPYQQAQKMVENYAPKAGFVDRDSVQLPDTRAIWFDLDLLEAVVGSAREAGGNGVRFYLASYDNSYPDTASWKGPKEYWGYNTLLMVPTKDSVEQGIHYARDLRAAVFPSDDEAAANHGSLTPPKKPGTQGALLIKTDEP